MLKRGDKVPAGAKRPVRDLGGRLVPCQAFYLSRRRGITVAMLADDFDTDSCPLGSIAFGMAPPVGVWADGEISHGVYAKTKKAARAMEKNVFRFRPGEYAGLISAPLSKARFAPDLVMVYCNSAQAMSLAAASRWDDGLPLDTRVSARAVCSDSVVQTVQTGRCQVCIPCGGDRIKAHAGKNDIVFTAPARKLGVIAEGLEGLARARARTLPAPSGEKESLLGRRYAKLARVLKGR